MLLDQLRKLAEEVRFEDVGRGSFIECLLAFVVITQSCEYEYCSLIISATDFLEAIDATDARHQEVKEDEIGRILCEAIQELRTAEKATGSVAKVVQLHLHELVYAWIVVHDGNIWSIQNGQVFSLSVAADGSFGLLFLHSRNIRCDCGSIAVRLAPSNG